MLRKRFLLYFLLILATACTQGTSDRASQQTENSTESAETEHEEADDHKEESQSDTEDAHEDEHEDEHGDEDENGRRELGAHEHGAAELTIALSGNEVAIDLQTPAFNVLGFEYAPASDEEKALLDESIAVLESGSLLQINSDAECTLVSATVHADVAQEEESEDASDETTHSDDETTHSDIEASYTLECEQSDNIASLDVSGLFDAFPNFEDIDVQFISETQQSATELTPDDSLILFE